MATPSADLVFTLLALAGLYLLFWTWYGGRGKPLTAREVDGYIQELGRRAQRHHDAAQSQVLLEQVRALLASDDGNEFVMLNLVRYRSRAAYPPGYNFGNDARAADRRYGRAIVWPLLRHGNLVLFIARRAGVFLEPEGADPWHYVAMVRYRSRRDFLLFALAIERDDITVHKWAAIEKTHVFPVLPVLSLFFVRACVAAPFLLAGMALLLAQR
jgi:hypothetical protein